MNNILYVTTFNKYLFKLCGRTFIRSLCDKNIYGDLLVCYEDDVLDKIQNIEKGTIVLNKIHYY